MEWCFPTMKECGGPRCMALVGIDCESVLSIVESGCDFLLSRKEGGMCREEKVGCERTIMLQRQVEICPGLPLRDHGCKQAKANWKVHPRINNQHLLQLPFFLTHQTSISLVWLWPLDFVARSGWQEFKNIVPLQLIQQDPIFLSFFFLINILSISINNWKRWNKNKEVLKAYW